MDKIMKKNESKLKSIELELDDFEEDLKMGASDHQFDLMSADWAFLLKGNMHILLKNDFDSLTSDQKERFTGLMMRTKNLKNKILEKHYSYPEAIDAFLENKLQT